MMGLLCLILGVLTVEHTFCISRTFWLGPLVSDGGKTLCFMSICMEAGPAVAAAVQYMP